MNDNEVDFNQIPANFFIEFSHDPAEYSPGEILSGSVIIQTEAKIPVSKVIVKLCGETDLHWIDETTGLENINKIELFSLKQDLLETLAELEDIDGRLLVGTLDIPFKFTLPYGIPGNFESDLGWTTYTCVAEIYANDEERLLEFRALFNVRPVQSQELVPLKRSLQCSVNFVKAVF